MKPLPRPRAFLNALAALAALVGIAGATAHAQPRAQWLATTHSFGTFAEEVGSVTTHFRVVNVGDKPLSLLSVHATCGCTSPSFSLAPIAPGDTGQVAVTYNPAGRPGRFEKIVRVETNAQPQSTALTISGVVIGDRQTLRSRYPVDVGPMKLRNTVVALGEVTKGRTRTAFLNGYNQSADTIRPTLTNLPRYVAADITPPEVPPGEQFTLTIFYDTSRAKDQWGLTTTEAMLRADTSADAATQAITLAAIVNEDFSGLTADEREKAPKAAFSTATLDLHRPKRGQRAEATLTIDNYGKKPLLLRRLYCPDSYVDVSCKATKVAPGAQAVVAVAVDTSALPPDATIVNTRLTVITNDPRRPSTPIRIVAEIAD